MIFATVGTHHDGFPRMLDALEALGSVELVVQHGYGRPPTNASSAAPFLSFPEMAKNFAAADVVVTHAGVGSILMAVKSGHVPVVMPRLKRRGEHVDDHQLELAERMAARGLVRVAWEGDGLAELVRDVPRRGPDVSLPETGLHAAVRDALHGARRTAPARRLRRTGP